MTAGLVAVFLRPFLLARDLPSFASFHVIVEFFAIAVAGLVFATGTQLLRRAVHPNLYILAVAFLFVGLLDLLHTLTFPGMPDFVKPADIELELQFWLSARILAAVALAATVFLPWDRALSVPQRIGLWVAVASWTLLTCWAAFRHGNWLPRLFVAGRGLTPFKVGVEYAIAALNVASLVPLLRRPRSFPGIDVPSLVGAIAAMALSEICFTRYQSPNDTVCVLGHIYKIVSYAFIYRAVFIAAVEEPYHLLESAHQTLRDSEERFRRLFEDSPVGMTVLDLEGRIQRTNRAIQRLIGFSAEDLTGKQVTDFAHPEEIEGDLQVVRDVSRGNPETAILERRFVKKDGAICSGHISLSLLRNSAGSPQGMVLVIEDVTQARTLESQLARAQKMEAVGRLAGGVAHDFNNLLTIINGYSEMIQDAIPEGNPVRAQAVEITRAGKKAAALTRQMLAFSRKQVVQPAVVDWNAQIAESQKMLKRLIGEDIRFEWQPAAGLHPVLADPGQLEQVLMNLVVNARDAMPKGGALTVATENADLDESYVANHVEARFGPHAVLSVSDTGIGMGPDVQAHLFEPFFTTKDPGKGTGLGLSVVYGIVKQAGGHISVYSEPGKGSVFRVYLPRAEAAGKPAVETAARPAAPARGESILFVEDDESVRKLGVRFLADAGYRVTEAPDGQKALDAAAKMSPGPDLVITDAVMPGISGQQLLSALRPKFPDAAHLLLSGFSEHASLEPGVLDPGLPFLQKPYSKDQLLRKVGELLGSRKAVMPRS